MVPHGTQLQLAPQQPEARTASPTWRVECHRICRSDDPGMLLVAVILASCAFAAWDAAVVLQPADNACFPQLETGSRATIEVSGIVGRVEPLYDGAPATFDVQGSADVKVSLVAQCSCSDVAVQQAEYYVALDGARLHECQAELGSEQGSNTCTISCQSSLLRLQTGYRRVNVYVVPGSTGSTARAVHLGPPLYSGAGLPTGMFLKVNSSGDAADRSIGSGLERGSEASSAVSMRGPRVSAYYTTLNQITAQIMQNISKVLGPDKVHSAEDVVRSGGRLRLDDIAISPNDTLHYPWPEGEINWYQDISQIGIYGLWRHRPGRPVGVPIPDFPLQQVREAVRWHARMAVAAGIDAFAFDASNWCITDDPITDVRQQGPTLQVFEEFSRLRAEGEPTPQLTVFHRLTGQCNLWQWYLDRFFNNAAFAPLVMRATQGDMSSKKVFFMSNSPEATNASILDGVRSNGGKEDVLPVYNWKVQGGPGNTSWWKHAGSWTYLSSCTNTTGTGSGQTIQRTTSISFTQPCDHYRTEVSPLGSQHTISKEDATMGLPFSSPGVLGGLHLKLQFFDAMRKPVDNLFSPSFNEYQIRPNNLSTWANNNTFLHVAGQAHDDDAHLIFNDGYTAGRNRNLEPSVTDRGYSLELYASCVRVARLQQALGLTGRNRGPRPQTAANGAAGAARVIMGSCLVTGELCCSIEADQAFVPVWYADQGTPGSSTLLSSDYAEVMRLTGGQTTSRGNVPAVEIPSGLDIGDAKVAGIGLDFPYYERCNPWNGPTGTFCANETIAYDATRYAEVGMGPFSALDYWTVKDNMPGNTTVLYRCKQPSNASGGLQGGPDLFVYGLSEGCAGQGVPGTSVPVAVIATAQTGMFPRALVQCKVLGRDSKSQGLAYYVAVDAPCRFGGEPDDVLGYVV